MTETIGNVLEHVVTVAFLWMIGAILFLLIMAWAIRRKNAIRWEGEEHKTRYAADDVNKIYDTAIISLDERYIERAIQIVADHLGDGQAYRELQEHLRVVHQWKTNKDFKYWAIHTKDEVEHE